MEVLDGMRTILCLLELAKCGSTDKRSKPTGKIPIQDKYTEAAVLRRYATADKTRQLSRCADNINLGLPMGYNNLLAVDVDCGKPDANRQEVLATALSYFDGAPNKKVMLNSTPSTGYHLILRTNLPELCKPERNGKYNGARPNAAPKIDIIMRGAFIVIPPSEYINERGVRGIYATLTELPEELEGLQPPLAENFDVIELLVEDCPLL